MEEQGLFNKQVLDRMIAEASDFSDLRDMIYIELVRFAKSRVHGPMAKSKVAQVLKMNRTTLVELLSRLGIWQEDRLSKGPRNRWGL